MVEDNEKIKDTEMEEGEKDGEEEENEFFEENEDDDELYDTTLCMYVFICLLYHPFFHIIAYFTNCIKY